MCGAGIEYYNSTIAKWEPLLERCATPTDIQFDLDDKHSHAVTSGGGGKDHTLGMSTSLRVVLPPDVRVNVTDAAITTLLGTLREWSAASAKPESQLQDKVATRDAVVESKARVGSSGIEMEPPPAVRSTATKTTAATAATPAGGTQQRAAPCVLHNETGVALTLLLGSGPSVGGAQGGFESRPSQSAQQQQQQQQLRVAVEIGGAAPFAPEHQHQQQHHGMGGDGSAMRAAVREYGEVSTVGVAIAGYDDRPLRELPLGRVGTYTYEVRKLSDGDDALSTVVVVWEVSLSDGRRHLTMRSSVVLRNCCGTPIELGCWQTSETTRETALMWSRLCKPLASVSLPLPLVSRSTVRIRPASVAGSTHDAPDGTTSVLPVSTSHQWGWSSDVVLADGSVVPHVCCAPRHSRVGAETADGVRTRATESGEASAAATVGSEGAWHAVADCARGDGEAGVFPFASFQQSPSAVQRDSIGNAWVSWRNAPRSLLTVRFGAAVALRNLLPVAVRFEAVLCAHATTAATAAHLRSPWPGAGLRVHGAAPAPTTKSSSASQTPQLRPAALMSAQRDRGSAAPGELVWLHGVPPDSGCGGTSRTGRGAGSGAASTVNTAARVHVRVCVEGFGWSEWRPLPTLRRRSATPVHWRSACSLNNARGDELSLCFDGHRGAAERPRMPTGVGARGGIAAPSAVEELAALSSDALSIDARVTLMLTLFVDFWIWNATGLPLTFGHPVLPSMTGANRYGASEFGMGAGVDGGKGDVNLAAVQSRFTEEEADEGFVDDDAEGDGRQQPPGATMAAALSLIRGPHVVEEVFELFDTQKTRRWWLTAGGAAAPPPGALQLPCERWRWEADWTIDMTGTVSQPEGWESAPERRALFEAGAGATRRFQKGHRFLRRRWYRVRVPAAAKDWQQRSDQGAASQQGQSHRADGREAVASGGHDSGSPTMERGQRLDETETETRPPLRTTAREAGGLLAEAVPFQPPRRTRRNALLAVKVSDSVWSPLLPLTVAARDAMENEGDSSTFHVAAATEDDEDDEGGRDVTGVSGVFTLPATRWPRAHHAPHAGGQAHQRHPHAVYALAYDVVAAPAPWGPHFVRIVTIRPRFTLLNRGPSFLRIRQAGTARRASHHGAPAHGLAMSMSTMRSATSAALGSRNTATPLESAESGADGELAQGKGTTCHIRIWCLDREGESPLACWPKRNGTAGG